jgi:excisionase family DNA binding protein
MSKDLTIPEAADELRAGKTLVYDLINAGELESYRVGARLRRITRDSLDAYKLRHRIEPADAFNREAG